ncbi:hypothetical protein L3X38_007292 [Prunus dulcis]|uniref:Uncharacterized protein n=1 Tax=Prunus dulcis TaxID=3755 RepID=A0AAD4ZU78_PRUDU|nr:hypothetical protein L3X38_007292 [Prunus dulcis]
MGNGEVRDEIETKYPPFPILVPREDSEDFVVGEFDVPRHTMLVVNAWAIHRDPEVWEDPTKFKPERIERWIGEGGLEGGYRLNPVWGWKARMSWGWLSKQWERIGEDMVDMSEGLGLMMPRVKPLEAMCKPRPFTLASM